MLVVLMYSILSLQIVYSVHLNCTGRLQRDRVTVILSVLLYNIMSL